jgi:hypothetical protein
MPNRHVRRLAVLLPVVAVLGCGTSGDRDQARAAAERLYAAVADGDGGGACAQLSPKLREELTSQEQSSCEDAILELDLQAEGARAERVEVFITEAAVHLEGGDTVFLDDTRQGWRVSAVGCRAQQPATPAQCEVQA